jgi:quinoprotein glucose dehydrogenase
MMRTLHRGWPLATALLGLATLGEAQRPGAMVEWPTYGGDAGGMKYWRWDTGDPARPPADSGAPARPGNFQATPLMLNDTLYLPTPLNVVVALDATSGRELWRFDPGAYRAGQPSNGTGLVHRGVAAWSDGRSRRIFINSRWRLIALDASTGRPIASFGRNGEIDLTADLGRPVNRRHYTNTSPPVIWGDLVILGNGVGDRLAYKGDPPGDVQAFDVRTGRRVWTFRTVPQPGEFGHDTWEDESWRFTGHTNVWAPFTVDSARGIVYLPVGTPSNDWYGGRRRGANLFGEALVALDARTGKRLWHSQLVHHGLWDYDLPAPPNVVTIRRGATRVDAVLAPTKQGWVFAFDRVTGAPLWPIEERAVPPSDVPGEAAWPTQPMPTRPAPFAMQGFGAEDVIAFTPAVKAAALAQLQRFVAGPLYTPPSLRGTITSPGAIGGAGWGGAGYDPETSTLFVKSTNAPALWKLAQRAAASDTNDADFFTDPAAPSLGVVVPGFERDASGNRIPPLPINKPPYGTLTAIDMATGTHRWQVPIGDTPAVRQHPALAGVALPPLGVAGSPGPLVTAGGLVFITGGGRALIAVDTRNGAELWTHDLGAIGYANPMTYRTRAGRQFVVIATGIGAGTALQAFALP